MPTQQGRDSVLNRLKSVDGHLRGVIKMVEEDAYCMDVIKQLQAARATGRAVYIAVPDTIGENVGRLRKLLDEHDLRAVKIIPFPEGKLQGVAAKLRAGLALASGVALAITDQAMESHEEE